MKINNETIQELNPCESRYNNFIANYPNYSDDLAGFLALDKITYKDKVWVVTRLFTNEQNVKWAILCAESVLSIYETRHPGDMRPRAAIDAAKAGKARAAIYAAAEAAYAAARHAAYAADAHAAASLASTAAAAEAATAAYAAYAAHAALDAAYAARAASAATHAAAYATTAASAYAATHAANTEQEQLNLEFMLEASKC